MSTIEFVKLAGFFTERIRCKVDDIVADLKPGMVSQSPKLRHHPRHRCVQDYIGITRANPPSRISDDHLGIHPEPKQYRLGDCSMNITIGAQITTGSSREFTKCLSQPWEIH